MRVLIVEDEPKVARALQTGLSEEGYEALVAETGEDGFYRLSTEAFDLVILDLMLPGRDGIEVLAAMREGGMATPVLVLTARDAVEDRVLGLDTGADDYLVKPFAFDELLARVRALLRRQRPGEALRLVAGDIEMDLLGREATRDGRRLELTAREFDLLEQLMRHRGETVTRQALARDVWRDAPRQTPLDNVIDVHISRLRKKLDEAGDGPVIDTVRGVGYRIEG